VVIGFAPTTTGNAIEMNYIGTTPPSDGSVYMPNQGHGVIVQGAAGNLIGQENTIAYNAGDGVAVVGESAVGNTISGNSIFLNSGLGIDLGGDGVTPNDEGDLDTGPNHLQNYPVLWAVDFTDPDEIYVAGMLNSVPDTEFLIEFFRKQTPGGGLDWLRRGKPPGRHNERYDRFQRKRVLRRLLGSSRGRRLCHHGPRPPGSSLA